MQQCTVTQPQREWLLHSCFSLSSSTKTQPTSRALLCASFPTILRTRFDLHAVRHPVPDAQICRELSIVLLVAGATSQLPCALRKRLNEAECGLREHGTRAVIDNTLQNLAQ